MGRTRWLVLVDPSGSRTTHNSKATPTRPGLPQSRTGFLRKRQLEHAAQSSLIVREMLASSANGTIKCQRRSPVARTAFALSMQWNDGVMMASARSCKMWSTGKGRHAAAVGDRCRRDQTRPAKMADIHRLGAIDDQFFLTATVPGQQPERGDGCRRAVEYG